MNNKSTQVCEDTLKKSQYFTSLLEGSFADSIIVNNEKQICIKSTSTSTNFCQFKRFIQILETHIYAFDELDFIIKLALYYMCPDLLDEIKNKLNTFILDKLAAHKTILIMQSSIQKMSIKTKYCAYRDKTKTYNQMLKILHKYVNDDENAIVCGILLKYYNELNMISSQNCGKFIKKNWKSFINSNDLNIISHIPHSENVFYKLYDLELYYKPLISKNGLLKPNLPIVRRFREKSKILCSDFRKSFDKYTHGLLNNIPLSCNVIYSGGSLYDIVTGFYEPDLVDLDLFVYGENKCETVIKIIRSLQKLHKIYCFVYRNIINIYIENVPRIVQIICVDHSSPSEIINTFDLSYVKMYYDGNNVYASSDCITSLQTQTVQVYNWLKTSRIHKCFRRGMDVKLHKHHEFLFPRTCIDRIGGKIKVNKNTKTMLKKYNKYYPTSFVPESCNIMMLTKPGYKFYPNLDISIKENSAKFIDPKKIKKFSEYITYAPNLSYKIRHNGTNTVGYHFYDILPNNHLIHLKNVQMHFFSRYNSILLTIETNHPQYKYMMHLKQIVQDFKSSAKNDLFINCNCHKCKKKNEKGFRMGTPFLKCNNSLSFTLKNRYDHKQSNCNYPSDDYNLKDHKKIHTDIIMNFRRVDVPKNNNTSTPAFLAYNFYIVQILNMHYNIRT